MDLLRSLLLVSALDGPGMAAARSSRADAVVIDLEEGPPPDAMAAAREGARKTVESFAADQRRLWVRIHPTTSLEARADIRATLGPAVRGYVAPHAVSANQMRYLDALLRDAEAAAGLEQGSVGLIPMIESAAGLLATIEIARASARVVALALDGADFCADMGVERTREGHELQYARSHIAICARAANLLALDSPFPFVRDERGLLAETTAARALGMHGKFVVGARQVAVVNAVFRPSAAEIAYARRLQAAHQEAEERGAEFAHLDGRIIDSPRAKRALRLLELATAIEAQEQQAAI